MKRRDFMCKATLASAAVIAGESYAMSKTKKNQTEVKCRIKVIKRAAFPELSKKYANEDTSPCPRFKDGDEFIISSPYLPPENFCYWAWADIRVYISQIFFGRGSQIVCCTDAVRPVTFYLERVEK